MISTDQLLVGTKTINLMTFRDYLADAMLEAR